jgi:gallate dioxygenase
MLEHDPEKLTEMTIAEYADHFGMEGSEIIMWLIMRGALTPKVKKLHQSYYLPSMTAIVTAIYENDGPPLPPPGPEYLEHIQHQLKGIEKLEGTYPFTLDRSVKAYRLNKFLHRLTDPEFRRRFREDEEKLYVEEGLTEEEKTLVRNRDWRGLIHYGVIFFMLEKFGAAIGVGNLHIYAAMRGQTIEEFQKTRNAQVTYSVAGKETLSQFQQPTQ